MVRRLLLICVLAALVAACGSGAGETGRDLVAGDSDVPTVDRTGPDVPVASPGTDSGGTPSGGGTVDPAGAGPGRKVTASPGQPNRRQVTVTAISALPDGSGGWTAQPVWTSGVEPCHVFDEAQVAREGQAIVVSVFEGGDTAGVCVELAETRTADVALGVLPPGTYTLTGALAPGDTRMAPAFTLVVG